MRNWGGSKVSRHAYAPRDSPPSHTLLDQNLDPRVTVNLTLPCQRLGVVVEIFEVVVGKPSIPSKGAVGK